MKKDTLRNSLGTVTISDTAIASISSISALKVPGVVDIKSGLVDSIAGIFSSKTLEKGVKVQITEKDVSIDIYIMVSFGVDISDVAWQVQEGIRDSVEKMTGLTVKDINVIVQSVTISKRK